MNFAEIRINDIYGYLATEEGRDFPDRVGIKSAQSELRRLQRQEARRMTKEFEARLALPIHGGNLALTEAARILKKYVK